MNNKRPFATNLGNIVPRISKDNNVPLQALKRGIESPGPAGRKILKASQKDPISTIENKIKKITISGTKSSACKKDTENQKPKTVVAVKAVKSQCNWALTKVQHGQGLEPYYEPPPMLPPGVRDYDRLQLKNIDAEPIYAFSVFQYLREKEKETRCFPYMKQHEDLNHKMRAALVDWMAELQQTFELNHDLLHSAVKIMDHFLMKEKSLSRPRFQLLGMVSLFLAAKFEVRYDEERLCPGIEDYIYLCDDAFTREEFLDMESEILRVLDFNINYPLAYTFLRRYARVASQTIETLTLSRYILETSLMEYSFIAELDSKMAAACLLLAMKMKQIPWDKTLEFYSGYQAKDLKDLTIRLNETLMTASHKTIRDKFEDEAFFCVAKIPLLETSKLLA